MNLGELTSLTTCPRCGFSIPIYPSQEFVTCRNCEKKINLKINNMFEGEKEMKYVMPCVPNVTIKNNKGEEFLIDYVFETNIVSLNNDNTLLIIEMPLSDTGIDTLNFLDIYKLDLEFDTRTLDAEKIKSKEMNFSNMKLIRKSQRYTSEFKSEENVYIFYNGKDNIDEIINAFLNNKNSESLEPLKIRIKYFEGATKLQKIQKGNWIDVYANKDIFVPVGERAMIPLGFALELPQGWEGHLAPRSSTFKTWGIIQTNHVGIVDDSYIGDNDQWHMPVYCLQGKVCEETGGVLGEGTWIRQGDKIGQFRIMEVMPEIEFEEVESFGNADRGGFGTTSSR